MKTLENFVSTLCGISRCQKEQNPASPNIEIVSMEFFLILLSKFLSQFKFLVSVFPPMLFFLTFHNSPYPASALQYLYIPVDYLLCDNLPKFLFLKFPSVSHNSNLNSYPQLQIFRMPLDLPIILSPNNLIFHFHCLTTRMFHVKRSTFHFRFSYISIIRCST